MLIIPPQLFRVMTGDLHVNGCVGEMIRNSFYVSNERGEVNREQAIKVEAKRQMGYLKTQAR